MTPALARTRALLDTPPPDPIPGQLAAPIGPRIGSVCSGYRGLDAAVKAVFGGTTAWVSDIDPGANKILAHHWPDVPNHGDLTTTDWSAVEPVDIFCGGYPCQPFSLAGKRKGTNDDRHIWPWIADALRVLRPQLAVFENVSGHLRLGFDTVLADLADLGFDAEWCTLRASDIGAAHQRNRLFLLAWSVSRQPAPDSDGVRGHGDRARGGRRNEPAARRVAPAHTAGVGEREPADEAHPVTDCGEARPVPGSRGVRTAADTHGDAVRQQPVGEPRRRGPAVVELTRPGAPADTGRRGLEQHRELPAGRDAVQPGVRQNADGRGPAAAPNWGGYGPAVARWEYVTGRRAPSPTNDLGRLNPPFVEWLMGLPAGHVTDVPDLSRTAQLKALGNGVVPQQAEAALRLLAARAGIPTTA